MADVSGFDGDVTIAGHGGAPYAFTFSVTQSKKDVGRYGGSRWNKRRGGILSVSGSVSVFLEALIASSAPSVDSLEPDGAGLVLTAMTGCTWTGDGILDFSTTHTFADPAVEATYNFEGTDDWVEAWDETA